MPKSREDGKKHNDTVITGDSHERNKNSADKKADCNWDRKPPCVCKPANDGLGAGRRQIVGSHEKTGGKERIAVDRDEKGKDSRYDRQVNVSDKMGSRKAGKDSPGALCC